MEDKQGKLTDEMIPHLLNPDKPEDLQSLELLAGIFSSLKRGMTMEVEEYTGKTIEES